MIVFDLKCRHNHQFEVWFRSSKDYENQKEQGFLECPYCGDQNITKALMAPNIGLKSNQKQASLKTETLPEHKPSEESTAFADEKSEPKQEIDHLKALKKAIPSEVQEAFSDMMKKVQTHVEKNFDHVGSQFAEEARRIHYGESKERPIYGEATQQETEELLEEGVAVLPLPKSVKKHS